MSQGIGAAGATLLDNVFRLEKLKIATELIDGLIAEDGIYGIRVDFASGVANSSESNEYQPAGSYFFFQQGTSVSTIYL